MNYDPEALGRGDTLGTSAQSWKGGVKNIHNIANSYEGKGVCQQSKHFADVIIEWTPTAASP